MDSYGSSIPGVAVNFLTAPNEWLSECDHRPNLYLTEVVADCIVYECD